MINVSIVCIYRDIYTSTYMHMYFEDLSSKLLFKQVLLKTMEYCLLFLILFFQDSLLFF